jgi:hypothetical protein
MPVARYCIDQIRVLSDTIKPHTLGLRLPGFAIFRTIAGKRGQEQMRLAKVPDLRPKLCER